MGVMAGVATRWAALQRPAMTTMILAVLPPMCALAARGGLNIMAALALGASAVSIATFMIHNREKCCWLRSPRVNSCGARRRPITSPGFPTAPT